MDGIGKHLRLLFVISILTFVLSFPNFSSNAQNTNPKKIFLPIITRDYDSTWQWEKSQELQLSPTPLDNPLTVIDHDGRLHIFWDVWGSSQAFIYHRYQTDLGWSDPAPIAQTLGVSSVLTPPIASPDGSIHLIWKNELNFGGPYRIMYAVWKDGRWSQEAELLRTSTNSAGGIIGLDNSGNPITIVSSSEDNFYTHYYYCIPSPTGCSLKVEIPTKNLTSYFYIDQFGGVNMISEAWINLVKHEYYSYWKDFKFQIDSLEIGGSVNSRNGLVDQQNNILFIRQGSVPIPGGFADGLLSQCLLSNHTWNAELAISGQQTIGPYEFANTVEKKVISVWQPLLAGNVVISLWDNCSIIETKVITPPTPFSSYGSFQAVAASDKPKKICLLLRVYIYPNDQEVYCVNIQE